MILLIHPPVAKPSEPPAGIARLSGALAAHVVSHGLVDLNIECALRMPLDAPAGPRSTWDRRALRMAGANISSLRNPSVYQSPGRYRRAVSDLGRALALSAPRHRLGLADYEDPALSPVRSADLVKSAAHPELSPFYPYFSKRISALIESGHPTHVGISVNYLSQALPAMALAGYVKRIAPGVRVIMGGGLITSWIKRNPAAPAMFAGIVDNMISGPGEGALIEMMTGRRPEALSVVPDYSGLPLGEYLSPGAVVPLSGSSGCWWRKCSFCPERSEGNPYVPMRPDDLVSAMSALDRVHRPVIFHLLDNAIAPAQLDALASMPAPIPWYGFARVSPRLADAEYCRALAASGCRMLKLGIESGSARVLDALGKGVDPATASAALRAIGAAGIRTYVYLLFGTPPEGASDAEETLAFAVEHALAITFLNLAVFNMPVDAPEAAALGAEAFSGGDLSLYADFRHPLGFGRAAVREFLDRRFRRHPAVAAILRRTPPVFTSNHGALVALD